VVSAEKETLLAGLTWSTSRSFPLPSPRSQ